MTDCFAGRFAGQVAVITGAASGIGLAVAERLAAEGAKVSPRDISAERMEAVSGVFAQKLVIDQSDEAAVRIWLGKKF